MKLDIFIGIIVALDYITLEYSILTCYLSFFAKPFPSTVTRPAFAPRTEAPKMMVDSVQVNDVAQQFNLIATSSDDFGGAFFPIFGLGLIAATILFLSPPLADE
jgi:hypothetical protein